MSSEETVETLYSQWCQKPNKPQVTVRSIIAGLAIGSVILISNFQFGLQSGFISMFSLPSALLGFAIFKALQSKLNYEFTDVENVFVQSVAVAVGTGPLLYGFVGIIPAIEKFLTPEESGYNAKVKLSLQQMMIWSTGLAFFGVFFLIPLRKQVIVKEKLPFPSGSATATLISVLHNTEIYDDEEEPVESGSALKSGPKSGSQSSQDSQIDPPCDLSPLIPEIPENSHNNSQNSRNHPFTSCTIVESQDLKNLTKIESYRDNIRSLVVTFLVSSAYTVFSYFVPVIRSLPVFGPSLAKNYLWTFQPSPLYIGQGMIMGFTTVSHMLFGLVLGWGILAPFANHMGWAPGEIDDWKTGGQGWILWISLSVMVADSVVAFLVVAAKSVYNLYISSQRDTFSRLSSPEEQESLLDANDSSSSSTLDANSAVAVNSGPVSTASPQKKQPEPRDVDASHLVSLQTTFIGLLVSTVVCVFAIKIVFGAIVPVYASLVLILVALFLSVLGVRALGETDLNPVSGIGKLSQLLFALIIPSSLPGAVLINLVAGGLAEAGAQQAGDLMQDLKTGHLIGASPKLQFVAQLIGTVYSIFLSSVMYKVYDSVYEIPGKLFRVPTAVIWIDCSRLVTGQGLPPHAMEFALTFGLVFAVISFLKNVYPRDHPMQSKLQYLPSGVAVGIGIYNTPSFTLARFIGGSIAYVWLKRTGNSHSGRISMIIFSSGLVLGEGLLSSLTMVMTSLNVPHF